MVRPLLMAAGRLDQARALPPIWLQSLFALFVGALAAQFLSAASDPLGAWHETLGPSRLLRLLLLLNLVGLIASLLARFSELHLALVLAFFALGLILPVAIASLALIVATFWLLLRRQETSLASTAMAALSAHVMLYSGVFPIFIEYSLKLDTWAVGFLIEALGRPVEIQGTSIFVGEGINIRLISFCGSIWPALTGLAAITTLASCVNGIGLRRGLTAAAAGLLMIIGLNWLRLAFMTTGQGSYDWFHEGSGTTLFRLSVIMIVVTTVLWAGMARDHHSVEEIRK